MRKGQRVRVTVESGYQPDHPGAGYLSVYAAWEAVMFAIVGILVVFCAVLGGYLMEKGQILVLLQPAELLIIAGAAAGTILAGNPVHILKGIVAGIMSVLRGSRLTEKTYLATLKMMYQLLN